MPSRELLRACIAETVGTFILVLFGTGAVAASVYTGAQVGLWQVAVVWGFGVTLAISATAAVSGAHLNPAVSLAFAMFRRKEFPVRKLPYYWAAQLCGAVLAGCVIYAAFSPFIDRFEMANMIVRGAPGSERSAMAFGEYFPNPAMYGTGDDARALVSPLRAMLTEAFGTGVLVFMIFALTDRRTASGRARVMTPLLIGFTVAVLISLFAPVTQAGWNPARDFGPRIVAAFAGWGDIAIPGARSGFWVYIAGPMIGAPIGALIYDRLLAARSPRQGGQTVQQPATPKPDVLFLCVHNAGRSQMAEAFFNRIAYERTILMRAASAGTMPGERVHVEVQQVMAEIGIDLSAAKPRLLSDNLAIGVKRVVTMGCQVDAEACPAVFLRGVEDWNLPDPKGRPLNEVRLIRDEIHRRVGILVNEMNGHGSTSSKS